MGKGSTIEWTDHTFNPWSGCTKVSPGCTNCYAETLCNRFPHLGSWGPGATRLRTSESNWRGPVAWNRAAQNAREQQAVRHGSWTPPTRPRVFCASLADWLDPEVPVEWLADLLVLIRLTPELDWLLLTKRPHLWRQRLEAVREWWGELYGSLEQARTNHSGRYALEWLERWLSGDPPANVWAGTTVESQEWAEKRWEHHKAIPARVRFWSCEPLLGPVKLPEDAAGNLHWVIAGGESGHDARPMHPDWARSLRDQCQAGEVAFFFKQWGDYAPCGPVGPDEEYAGGAAFESASGGRTAIACVSRKGLYRELRGRAIVEIGREHAGRVIVERVGKKAAGRELDRRTWDEFPARPA